MKYIRLWTIGCRWFPGSLAVASSSPLRDYPSNARCTASAWYDLRFVKIASLTWRWGCWTDQTLDFDEHDRPVHHKQSDGFGFPCDHRAWASDPLPFVPHTTESRWFLRWPANSAHPGTKIKALCNGAITTTYWSTSREFTFYWQQWRSVPS